MPAVEYYTTPAGVAPVAEWLAGLGSNTTVARILTRIGRVELGSFGDHQSLGDGLWELRLDFGPGYRLYYSRVGSETVLLLAGGDKSTQKRDIKRARGYLAEYKSRKE